MAREQYVGRAGQLATMAEFLLRGYNVAIPEVDEGDDVFVVNNRVDQLWRIQVKTAIGVRRGYGYSGQFLIPLTQLQDVRLTDLYYVLCLRYEGRWDFVPILQTDLLREHERYQTGVRAGDAIRLYLAFKDMEVICSSRNWQRYRNNWSPWPVIAS